MLEYIDGQSLESLLRTGAISRERGRDICRDLGETLVYLHGRQTLHRDLKPSNILITHQGGVLKIIDFNLSDNDSFIILKNPAGSGKYIAPELRLPDAKATPEADIYSMGVITMEIAEASSDPQLKEAARTCMSVGHPLYATDIVRGGEHISAYHGAKKGGLHSFCHLPPHVCP